MNVSAEIIAVLGVGATLLVSFVSGFAWMIRRSDAPFERLARELGEVRHELGEVKVSVARLEGPLPRLLSAR